MPLLFIALLSILAGVLLLAKTRKEQLGKFFTFISWFFVVVGFILFVGFVFGATWRLTHRFPPRGPMFHNRMMMHRHHPGMPAGKCCVLVPEGEVCCAAGIKAGKCCTPEMKGGKCCADSMKAGMCCQLGMNDGKCCAKMCPMGTDSTMKCCPAHAKTDSIKLP